MSIKNSLLVLVFTTMVPALSLAQTGGGFPTPTDFDPKAPAPANLPLKMDIPPLTRMTAQAFRKVPLPATVLASKERLLEDPDLQEASFETDGTTVHAHYQWEGGRSSEGYDVKGMTFHLGSFKYPDSVVGGLGMLGFSLNRQIHPGQGLGNFPGLAWYGANRYIGTAELQGDTVLVFTTSPLGPQENASFPPRMGFTLYLDAQTLRPAMLDTPAFVYLFSYTPAPGLQIHAAAPYLKAIQWEFGVDALR